MPPRKSVFRRGHRISFSVEGEGPLVVLVQGLGMSSRAWLNASEPLLALGFRVAAVDNRGTGLSDAFIPPYSMREFADDVACVIDHIKGPAIIVGISLGGMIAQHVAISHPNHVAGLVLAATTVGPPFGKQPSPRVLKALVLSLLGRRESMNAVRCYLVHPNTLKNNPELFNAFDSVVRSEKHRFATVVGQLGAACFHNTFFALENIDVPVEIIAGDSDEIIPTKNASVLASRIKNAKVTILPNAAHAFPLEYPLAIPDAVVRVHHRIQAIH